MDRKISAITGLAAAAAGVAAFAMRHILYRVGLDGKNLLVGWHPLTLGILAVLAGLALAVTIAALRGRKGKCLAPVGKIAAVGSLILALCLTAEAFSLRSGGAPALIWILAHGAGAAMLVEGFFQWQNKQPSFLCSGILCLFLALYLVNRYQAWSKDPQLMDYVLILCGLVLMMLYAYHMAAGCQREAGYRSWLILGCLGSFLCLAGGEGEAFWLCFGSSIWMLSGLFAGVPEEEALL